MKKIEPLSVIVLTRDDERDLAACLDALLPQLKLCDEVIIVDSVSSDRTMDVARTYASSDARVRVRVHEGGTPLFEARNSGIVKARTDIIAMLSAQVIPDEGWLRAVRRGLQNADVVYGRQRHAPARLNSATVSRGLRYHRFEAESAGLPETYASNVNAAYRRFVFDTLRFDESSESSEDRAFARAARLEGFRIAYAPDAIVFQKEASTWRAEWRKHLRDGAAAAKLREVMGAPNWHLAWAVAVAGLALIAIVAQSLLASALLVLAFFTPTLRRVRASVARRYKPIPLMGGVIASPFFDLAFVASYLARRVKP